MITRSDQSNSVESEPSAFVLVIVTAAFVYVVAFIAFVAWYL